MENIRPKCLIFLNFLRLLRKAVERLFSQSRGKKKKTWMISSLNFTNTWEETCIIEKEAVIGLMTWIVGSELG